MEYKEIFRLKKMLENANIPHEICNFLGMRDGSLGYQIGYPVVPPDSKCVCSVLETKYSYGAYADRLEIKGLLTDEELKHAGVLGHLTAEDVFERIKTHYENSRKE